MLGVHSLVCSVAHTPVRMILSSVPARLSPRCSFLQRKPQRASQRDDSQQVSPGLKRVTFETIASTFSAKSVPTAHDHPHPAAELLARRCVGVAFLGRQSGRTKVLRTTLTVQTKKLHAAELAKATKGSCCTGINRCIASASRGGMQRHGPWRDTG
ncbi:hypothetical protein AAKU67_003943 [Oxalobacteraceae bacterium GrIS 2.11]